MSCIYYMASAPGPLAFNKMKYDMQMYLHTSTIKPEIHDSHIANMQERSHYRIGHFHIFSFLKKKQYFT